MPRSVHTLTRHSHFVPSNTYRIIQNESNGSPTVPVHVDRRPPVPPPLRRGRQGSTSISTTSGVRSLGATDRVSALLLKMAHLFPDSPKGPEIRAGPTFPTKRIPGERAASSASISRSEPEFSALRHAAWFRSCAAQQLPWLPYKRRFHAGVPATPEVANGSVHFACSAIRCGK